MVEEKNKNKKFLRGNECGIYIGGGPRGYPSITWKSPGTYEGLKTGGKTYKYIILYI